MKTTVRFLILVGALYGLACFTSQLFSYAIQYGYNIGVAETAATALDHQGWI